MFNQASNKQIIPGEEHFVFLSAMVHSILK